MNDLFEEKKIVGGILFGDINTPKVYLWNGDKQVIEVNKDDLRYLLLIALFNDFMKQLDAIYAAIQKEKSTWN